MTFLSDIIDSISTAVAAKTGYTEAPYQLSAKMNSDSIDDVYSVVCNQSVFVSRLISKWDTDLTVIISLTKSYSSSGIDDEDIGLVINQLHEVSETLLIHLTSVKITNVLNSVPIEVQTAQVDTESKQITISSKIVFLTRR